jgi:signal transduction histidine kinase
MRRAERSDSRAKLPAASISAIAVSMIRRARRLLSLHDETGLESHVARVVHDLKQPLTTLSVSLEMLALSAPRSPHVERCQRALRRQRELIDDLLVLTGKNELAELVDLKMLLLDVAEDLRPPAEKRQVELVLDLRAEPLIRGNRLALSRAFSNVLSNAVEITPERSRVEIVLLRQHESVCIEVRDQGPGVPSELRERVFEPFFTTRQNGTGLGLAITRVAVKAHHGTVRFIDTRGGCVRFEIPCRDWD